MIDSIQTFGDSFMYGSDLADCDGTAQSQFSQLTWPALCAKELGLNYNCYGVGAAGNKSISLAIIENASSTSLNIINWSWIDRFEYIENTSNKSWFRSILPTSTDDISKFYYKHLNSELDDKITSLVYIYSAHSYLKTNSIPFIATYMDPLIFDINWHSPPEVIKLQDIINDDFTSFPNNQTFLEWSRSNGYPESKGWHPLKQAHREAAKIWLPIYKEAINTYITNLED